MPRTKYPISGKWPNVCAFSRQWSFGSLRTGRALPRLICSRVVVRTAPRCSCVSSIHGRMSCYIYSWGLSSSVRRAGTAAAAAAGSAA